MKKALVLVLTLVIAITSIGIFGCGGAPDENTLVIDLLEAGYGVEWAEELEKIFETENPGKNVDITSSRTMSLQVENKLQAGPSNNHTDLFITSYDNVRGMVDLGSSAVSGYDCVLADMSELYNAVVDGKEIKNKMHKSFFDVATYKGKQYMMPWATGSCGFMYNKTLFDYYGWTVPTTMSEFLSLCDEILEDTYDVTAQKSNVIPIVYPGGNAEEYWAYVYNVWHAQYEGLNNYNDFWEGGIRQPDDSYDYTDGYLVYQQEGRKQSLQALESILSQDKYILEGSTTNSHTLAQSEFLYGRAAIIPTGDWIENEMKGNSFTVQTIPNSPKTEIAYMPTPLLDVVDSWKGYEGQTGIDESTGIDKSELYQRYVTAKTISYNLGYKHTCLVPSYANAKSLAFDFLKLMASDRGIEIYLKYAKAVSPYMQDYDEEMLNRVGASDFLKSQIEYNKGDNFIVEKATSPIRYKASIVNYNVKAPEAAIVAGTSASDIFTNEYNYVRNRWNQILISAGLN